MLDFSTQKCYHICWSLLKVSKIAGYQAVIYAIFPTRGESMYKKFISAFHMLNLLLQSIYSLALPIGVGALASLLLTKYASAPRWIWAVLMTLGTFVGLYSMIKFILSASANLDRMEKAERDAAEAKRQKEENQMRLRRLAEEDEKKESE